MQEKVPHLPVLLDEVLGIFKGQSLRVFVDGTLGAGGHAEAILTEHPEIEYYVGIDQDPLARALASERLRRFGPKVRVVAGNARHLDEHLRTLGLSRVDGILLDVGVSSMHLDSAERGFSFSKDGPLDMRMNPDAPLSAWEIVNHWSEAELGRIVRDYGEEVRWRRVARTIVEARQQAPIDTTQQLLKVLEPVLRPRPGKKINPMTLVFQGIRIAVNDELGALESVLPLAVEALNPGGRLGIISFHSLEDRMVKRFMRDMASDKVEGSGIGGIFLDKEPSVKDLTRKPLTASESELAQNPRSRSAKLRAVQKY